MVAPSSEANQITADGLVADVRITFFNLVLAKVRDTAMDRVKGRVFADEVPTGTDPVALVLGLQSGQYFQAVAPEALRNAIEIFSRALLREERRTRYVSRQVSLMLAINSQGRNAGESKIGNTVENSDYKNGPFGDELASTADEFTDFSHATHSSDAPEQAIAEFGDSNHSFVQSVDFQRVGATAGAPLPLLSDEILLRSSLANELRCFYHGLVVGHHVSVTVNGVVDINVRLSTGSGLRIDGYGACGMGSPAFSPSGLNQAPSSSSHSFDSLNELSDSSVVPPLKSQPSRASRAATPSSFMPRPNDALLTIAEPEELVALLEAGPASSPHLLALLPHFLPTSTLVEVATRLELPLDEVHGVALQLCSWGLAFICTAISAESVFQVAPDAPSGTRSSVARAFAASFLGGRFDSTFESTFDANGDLSLGAYAAAASAGVARNREGRSTGEPDAIAVLAAAPVLSLPCILSIFDGSHTLQESLNLLPRALVPYGVDIVVWLLRRRMLLLVD